MSKFPFPWLALGAGLLFALLLLMSMQAPPGESPIPLLTQLLMAEFGFVLNAVGAWLALKRVQSGEGGAAGLLMLGGCAVMAVVLGLIGFSLWPEGGLGGAQ